MATAKTNNCSATDMYESLVHCKGKTVLPGIRPEVYGIPKAAIAKWPALPDLDEEGLSMGKIAVYKGDFTLAADKVFNRMSVLTEASNITSTSQGEKPSKTFLNSATFKHESVDEEATGFCRLVNSDDYVFVARQRNGKFRVIGNEKFETNVNPAQDSGMSVTDVSGTTFEVTVTDECPAPFYVGKLKTDIGTIDCSTGEITED